MAVVTWVLKCTELKSPFSKDVVRDQKHPWALTAGQQRHLVGVGVMQCYTDGDCVCWAAETGGLEQLCRLRRGYASAHQKPYEEGVPEGQ